MERVESSRGESVKARSGWGESSRGESVKARRRRQAEHDRKCGPRITELKSQGLSWKAVAKQLNDEGLRAPKGGPWLPSQAFRVWTRFEEAALSSPPERWFSTRQPRVVVFALVLVVPLMMWHFSKDQNRAYGDDSQSRHTSGISERAVDGVVETGDELVSTGVSDGQGARARLSRYNEELLDFLDLIETSIRDDKAKVADLEEKIEEKIEFRDYVSEHIFRLEGLTLPMADGSVSAARDGSVSAYMEELVRYIDSHRIAPNGTSVPSRGGDAGMLGQFGI